MVFAAVVVFYVLFPLASSIEKTKADIQTQRMEIEKKYEQRKEFGDVSDKLKEIESQLGILNKPFVLHDRKLEFITELEELANKNNVEQNINLQMEKAQERGFYRMIPLNIKTSAKFENQMDYLSGLETLDEYVNIYFLTLDSGQADSFEAETGEKEGADRIEMLIRANTFWAEEVGKTAD